MQNKMYPSGTVQALLETDLITPQTKLVLQQRLSTEPVINPHFFTTKEFELLQAICNRLIPQQRSNPIDIAGQLDTDLFQNKGDGWRYNALPEDRETFKKGIAGIEETAKALYKNSFVQISEKEQDNVLTAIQKGTTNDDSWKQVSPILFFEELLSRLSEIYYSHPLGRDEIGETSYADAHGWHHIQLNEKNRQEPLPIGEKAA